MLSEQRNEKLYICTKVCGAKCCRTILTPPLTVFDIVRICEYLKMKPMEFLDRYCIVKTPLEDAEEILRQNPNDLEGLLIKEMWRGLEDVVNNVYAVFLKHVDGVCIFLDKTSNMCRINDVKPMCCKVMPLPHIVLYRVVRKYLGSGGIVVDECPLMSRLDLLEEERRLYPLYRREIKVHYEILACYYADFVAVHNRLPTREEFKQLIARICEDMM